MPGVSATQRRAVAKEFVYQEGVLGGREPHALISIVRAETQQAELDVEARQIQQASLRLRVCCHIFAMILRRISPLRIMPDTEIVEDCLCCALLTCSQIERKVTFIQGIGRTPDALHLMPIDEVGERAALHHHSHTVGCPGPDVDEFARDHAVGRRPRVAVLIRAAADPADKPG